MDILIEGYRQFRKTIWPEDRARYEALATWGQSPHTLVIACSDSRVDPQTVFGAVPGELFVIRNIAALIPPYTPDAGYHGTSAALEYGVRVLGVSRVVVLGHAQCGGVRAMVEGAPAEAQDFVAPWIEIARPALALPPPDHAHALTHYENEVVRLSLANLMAFPWIDEAVRAGRLKLGGFRFDIHTGELSLLAGGNFEPVS
jgi:carbonic anhydrase